MTDALPILYSFRRCPYAMRARMSLMLAGQQVRLREIILRDKPDEMLVASEKGTVPVLILPDGQVIDESLEVMIWAIGAPDQMTLNLIARNDGPFKHDLDRYKYSTRYEDVDETEHRTSGAAFLSDLNVQLAEHGQLCGTEPQFADYAIFPFVRQFRIADPDWFDAQDWPHLQAWLKSHMESDLFTSIMPKYPLWKDTGEEILFGTAEAA